MSTSQDKVQQPGSTWSSFTKTSTLLSCGIAIAAIAFLDVFSSDSSWIESGRTQNEGTHKAHERIEREDDRLILSVAGVLDTRTAPGIGANTRRGDDLVQWYVQTVPRLTESERREIQADAGMELGEYFPNNAYLVLCSSKQAASFAKARHVVWVGQRPASHKIDPVLSDKSIQNLQQNGTLTWMKLDLFLFPNAFAQGEGTQQYSKLLQQSKQHMSEVLEVRSVASSKIILEMPLRDASKAITWLSNQAETLWIGKREVYSTRNADSDKIITLGGSEQARYRTNELLDRNGLNGRGQMIAVSDTGLDFDHCMLWQESFPFPCYDGFDQEAFNPLCPASGYAALLGNQDFYFFVNTMLKTEVDVPLLAGNAAGASSAIPPLDIQFPDRETRILEGYKFELGGDPDIDLLLRVWSNVRPKLLPILTDPSMCEECGGEMNFVNGTAIFVPENDYRFLKADRSNEVARERIGDEWRVLNNLMLEKCFCFFTIPSLATEDPLESWKGMIPPVRALQDLAATPTAAITRKAAGLTALPYDVLSEICNISKMQGDFEWPEGTSKAGQRLTQQEKRVRDSDGVLVHMCEQTVEFEWSQATGNITYNVCDLEWDARGLETAMAKCFDLVYLVPPPNNVRPDDLSANEKTDRYTYSSTLAWWNEYSRIPPFNSVDRSRRVVNAYYLNEGCEACGMCERLRIDSRDYPGMIPSAPMPARIDRNQMLAVYLQPDEEDWRLDSFEAASVDFLLKVTVTAVVDLLAAETTLRAIDNAGVCLMSNQAYEDAPSGVLKHRSYWEEHCLNRMAVSNRVNLWNKTAEAGVLRTVEFEFDEIVDPLERSADGWRVVVLNNETRRISFSVVMQLYSKGVACSDKLDGEAQLSENSHSVGLGGNTHISSVTDEDICELEGRTYCDATATSGRQLDECLVCGGSCFRPDCTPDLCPENNDGMVRVRFLGDFPAGHVSKVFTFGDLSAPFAACPSPTSPEVRCEGVDCNEFGECRGRRETYTVDTHFLTVQAGEEYTFPEGAFNLDYASTADLLSMSARVLERPDLLLRQKINLDGKGAGGATLHLPQGSEFFPVARAISINGTNFTFATVSPETDHFEASGNVSELPKLLNGLRISTPAGAGTDRKTRQFMLRIQLRFVKEDGSFYRTGTGSSYEAGTVSCPFSGSCTCQPGFTGAACDMMARPLDIWITVEPRARGHRVMPAPIANAGRRPILNRDGHGTHVVTSIVGKADDSESSTPGTSQVKEFDALAHGAFLAFIDIGESGNTYLTPPESLGEGLMGQAYEQAGARVMLHPWNCEDIAWWKKQDEPFEPEQAVAGNKALYNLPSICNRYTTGTWEIDDYIARHPDLTVVFPGGNNGQGGERTVSAPGTCKNCITVGVSQGWPSHLAEAANFSLTQCRAEDCPQDVDKTETCAALGKTSPEQLPACCRNKYGHGVYSPDYVDLRSSRGPTVSSQAEYSQSDGDIFSSLDQIVMRRMKPDLVAPGLNVVSGRSDGNPSSGGTYGCRCCASPEGNTDRSALMTMSGASQAAAKVTAAAAVVRQYFAEGYYPSGIFELAPAHEASAALVKAVLVASADVMSKAVGEGGQTEDLSWRVGPTEAAGFGRVNIGNVLRMGTSLDRSPPATMPPEERCECTGNNTNFWQSYPEWNRTRGFPTDYGTQCQAWHALPGGAKCDEMFPDNLDQRPSPFGSETYDLSCCMQWCFVEPSCPTAIQWTAVPSLYYSFSTCPETSELILHPETCEFGPRNIATLAKDHSIDRPGGNVPPFAPLLEPISGAITQGESVAYVTYVMEATERHPLVVAMVYTDPPNALGSANVLVNDLDLEVTITPIKLQPGQSLRNSSKELDTALTVLYQGNEVEQGDQYNNVERVRVFKIDRPSRVLAKVTAVRVVASAQPGAGPGLCQTFALVITGNLEEDATADGTEVITEPSPITPGICGRPDAEIVEIKEGIKVWLLAVIISCSIVGCIICICLAYRYVSQSARTKTFKAEDSSAPEHVGYMSRVEKVEKEAGTARGGGPDFIILADAASDVDDYYVGLPILITEGNGESEQSTITKYDGRSRRAEAEFDMGPTAGSKYAISHLGSHPMGYKVGEAGYIPITEMPDAAPGQPKIYQKQMTTLGRARHKFGQLADKQLAAMGIGRPKRVWNKREEAQAVHAGIQIGKPVTSEDLYTFAMQGNSEAAARKAHGNKNQDTPMQQELKSSYFDHVERLKQQQSGRNMNKEGLRGRNMMRKLTGTATNDAPPLRTQGGLRQQGERGYLKEYEEPAIISSQAGGVSLQTWDVETASPPGPLHNGNGHSNGDAREIESPDRPKPEEPRSGTKDEFEMVSATVTMGKTKRSPNGNGKGNGHGNGEKIKSPRTPEENGAGVALRTPRTVSSAANGSLNGGAKLTPAQKAMLIDQAFGPKTGKKGGGPSM